MTCYRQMAERGFMLKRTEMTGFVENVIIGAINESWMNLTHNNKFQVAKMSQPYKTFE